MRVPSTILAIKKRGTSVPLKRIMNIVKKHENENEEKPSLTVYLYYSAQTTVSSMAHKKNASQMARRSKFRK